MGALLGRLFAFFLGDALPRILTGAGLALITASWLGPLIDGQISQAVSQLNSVSHPFAHLLALSGVFTGIGYVLSAVGAKAAIYAASSVTGVMRK